jgi:hypothetical protein
MIDSETTERQCTQTDVAQPRDQKVRWTENCGTLPQRICRLLPFSRILTFLPRGSNIVMKLRPALLLELAVNLLLPWLTYRLAQPYWGETGGLIASAVPPVVWSVIELIRFRRVDALSVMVLLGIVLSIGAMLLGGGPRMLLFRESLVSGAIGIAFLMSLALRRPIIFYLARASVAREMANGAAHIDMLWRDRPAFAAALRILTATWGLGLTTETLLRGWMAWHWPIERVLVASPFVGYGIYGALMVWTLWYRRILRDRGGPEPEPQSQPQPQPQPQPESQPGTTTN